MIKKASFVMIPEKKQKRKAYLRKSPKNLNDAVVFEKLTSILAAIRNTLKEQHVRRNLLAACKSKGQKMSPKNVFAAESKSNKQKKERCNH